MGGRDEATTALQSCPLIPPRTLALFQAAGFSPAASAGPWGLSLQAASARPDSRAVRPQSLRVEARTLVTRAVCSLAWWQVT